MRIPLSVLLLGALGASALILPNVTVEKTLLNKYGILDDVNAPNYFSDSLKKFSTFMESVGPAGLPINQNLISSFEQQLATLPPAPQSIQFINMAALVHGKELMQTVAAHMLNIWERFRKTAETLNFLEYQTFTYLKSASNASFITDCRKDRMLLFMAHKSMDEFDPIDACDRFLNEIRENPSFISKRIHASMISQSNLAKLQNMVENGDKFTLKDMQEFLEEQSIIDLQNFYVFNSMLTDELKDYTEPLSEMAKNPVITPIITFLTKRLSEVADSQLKPEKKE